MLPNLSHLVERGCLSAFDPPFPPLTASLYATAVTGVSADRHGVLTSADCDRRTGKLRDPLSTSLRSQPLWSLLGQQGLRSIAVGCPVLYPIADFPGIAVTREIFSGMNHPGKPWMPPPATVSAPQVASRVPDLCLRPEELTPAELIPFLPDLGAIDQKNDSTVANLAIELSQTASLHAIATSVMQEENWHFAAVAPRLIAAAGAELRRADAALQRSLVEACYRLADEMLGKLIHVSGDNTTFLVLSGGAPGGRRGFLCLAGPGTRQDRILHNGSLLDVAPAILNLLGCPIPRDMHGSPLAQAFEHPTAVTRSEASLAIPPQNESTAPWIHQLQALGYRDPMAWEAAANAQRVDRERVIHLAGLYLAGGRAEKSVQVLEEWYSRHPNDSDCAFRLCYTCSLAGNVEKCRALLSAVVESPQTRPVLALLRACLAAGEGQRDVALDLLRAADAEDSGNSPLLTHAIGNLFLDLGQFDAAEAAFSRMAAAHPECWPAYDGRAQALLAKKRPDDAADALRQSLHLNFMSAKSHSQLAWILLAQGEGARAAQAFRIAALMP